MNKLFKLLPALVIFLFSTEGFALLTPVTDSIPMKDGRKLAADIYIPSGMSQAPVILVQTPYNRLLYRLGLPLGIGQDLNGSNYIIVVVDWRGFYGSRKAGYPGNPDRGTDGYYVVEWIASQNWSNGKVGTWGPSALGKVQFQTAQKNPPHLTCICPLVAGPQFNYSEYFPNGALRTEYVEQLDGLGFGLSATLMAHPYYDNTWTFAESLNFYPDSIRIPAFMIGGWYDHNVEVMLPFFKAIQAQSPVNVRDRHKLLMGPWVHGGHGTAQVGTTLHGELSYPNSASTNDSMALLFFDYHLRNVNNGWDAEPKVTYYQMGVNKWEQSSSWPPSGTRNVIFYMHGNGLLDHKQPSQLSDSLAFSYDPRDPSPTVGGPTLRADLEQGPYNQAGKVENRNDLLVYTTSVLTENAVLKGQVKVHLKVSSDRIDTDFTIRLTDVYPDGRSMLVNDGIMRMRFRNGFTQAQIAMMTPGKVYDCVIELPNTSITFLAGHKIRIDVSSSNYPRFNRNMNNGGNMYPSNSLDSLINPLIASNMVYSSSRNASYVEMPLVGYTSAVDPRTMSAGFTIYPNPAGESLRLSFDSPTNNAYSTVIVNNIGQVVWEKELERSSAEIDISSLSPGPYMIIVNTDGRVISRKFVKM
jgi:predicted acyl esterase